MTKTHTDRTQDHKDRKISEELTRDALFDFLYDDKEKELLNEMWSKVKEGDTKMMMWFADQYFGKAKQRADVTTDGKPLGNFDFSKLTNDELSTIIDLVGRANNGSNAD